MYICKIETSVSVVKSEITLPHVSTFQGANCESTGLIRTGKDGNNLRKGGGIMKYMWSGQTLNPDFLMCCLQNAKCHFLQLHQAVA